MIPRITCISSLLPGRWREEGNLLVLPGGQEWRAMEVIPYRLSRLEEELDGPETDAFYARLAEALGALPSHFEAQLILCREKSGEENKDSLFPLAGLVTRVFLVERALKRIGEASFSQGLIEAGFELRNLGIEEFGALRLRLLGCGSESDPTQLPDLLWEGSHLEIASRRLKVVSLTDSPQATLPGGLQSLFELPMEFVFSMRLRVPDRARVKKDFERKRRMSHALASTQGRELTDLGSGVTLSASEEVLMRLIEGQETLLDIQACFILLDEVLETLEEKSARLVSTASLVSGIGLFPENVGNLPVLQSHIPGAAPLPPRELKFLSKNATHLLPLLVDRSLSLAPAPLSVVSRSFERCRLALFSPENHAANAFVCGATGSGKSFLVNSLIASLLEEEAKAQVTVFDVGGSYRKLVNNLGGSTLDLSPDQARHLVNTYLRGLSLAPTVFLKTAIATLCGAGEHITHSHRVAIENILSDCEGAKFSIRLLENACVEHAEAAFRDIALWLRPYLSWDDLPASRFDLEALNGQIRAFDFRLLDGDPTLQRLVLLTLVQGIWDRLKRGEAPKTLVVFDEVWKLLGEARTFLEDMYRTIRKHSGGVVSVTQNIGDFGNEDLVRVVVSNSFVWMLLQGSGNSSLLSKLLDLSPSDLSRVLSLTSRKGMYSEFWVRTPFFTQVMRLIASSKLHGLAHTEGISVTAEALV